jgi:hypothetical protein
MSPNSPLDQRFYVAMHEESGDSTLQVVWLRHCWLSIGTNVLKIPSGRLVEMDSGREDMVIPTWTKFYTRKTYPLHSLMPDALQSTPEPLWPESVPMWHDNSIIIRQFNRNSRNGMRMKDIPLGSAFIISMNQKKTWALKSKINVCLE